MASYRFCRTDDIPLLAEAHNRCYAPHFPGLPPLNVQEMKQHAIRELQLWASSSMVAFDGREPVAVLLAGKRERETLIWRIGVKPGHERRGHGRHLLTSLSSKLAILGPPKILAEVPAAWTAARAFFEACGFRIERTYSDYALRPRPGLAQACEIVAPASIDDLLDAGALDLATDRCWERASVALVQRKDRIRGWAIGSAERLEAWLLYQRPEVEGQATDIVAFHSADPSRGELWLETLLRHHASAERGEVRIAKVHEGEIALEHLRSLGFEPGPETIGYAADATPG